MIDYFDEEQYDPNSDSAIGIEPPLDDFRTGPADAEIDQLLEKHLLGELSGQLSRAESAFRSHIASTRDRRKIGWAIVGLAAMILLGVGAAMRIINQPAPMIPSVVLNPTVPWKITPPQPQIQTVVFARAIPGEIIEESGRPAQVFQHDVIEQIEYYDPASQTLIQTTIPRSQIILVDLKEF